MKEYTKQQPQVALVATDLDGTLLDSHKNVSEATRQAIRRLKEHGILFGVVSGRPVESGMVLARNWGLEDSISFLIGMNGGVLYDTRRKEKETYSLISGSDIADIIHEYKKHFDDLHFEVMVGNDRYVEFSTPETLENADLYGENEIIVDLDEFLEGRYVNKLIIRSRPEQQKDVAKVGETIHIPGLKSVTTSDVLYEFVEADINKGFGLQKLCDHYGINLDNVVAFGDENNDQEMIILAGTGVAMKNALPSVKAIADVVSDYTNDEDALAHYINEVILPSAQGKIEKQN